ncbi:PilW family protein [Candidatus Omnitrophota bacterium]
MCVSIRQKNSKGFTLAEVLVAFAIFIAMLALIYGMFYSGLDIWGTAKTHAELQAKARIALNLMVSELRNATRTSVQNPSPNLSVPPMPNNSEIAFYLPQDLDGDGLVTDANGEIEWDTDNQIRYQFIPDESQIRRLDNSGWTIFARDVADLRFLDMGIDPALSLDAVRINLSLKETTEKQRDITIRLSSIVALRN